MSNVEADGRGRVRQFAGHDLALVYGNGANDVVACVPLVTQPWWRGVPPRQPPPVRGAQPSKFLQRNLVVLIVVRFAAGDRPGHVDGLSPPESGERGRRWWVPQRHPLAAPTSEANSASSSLMARRRFVAMTVTMSRAYRW